jgi:DNA repair photolyase
VNRELRRTQARTILSKTSGFIREAGFSHSLTPARNCTFGCLYCYVPTLRIQGGLQPEDWRRWGQFTTIKQNAATLLAAELRPGQKIYCSPLTDPYQPAEAEARLMPAILEALAERPPAVVVIQTRGSLILRDLHLLQRLAMKTRLRISYSLTTNRDDVRRRYEPHCSSIDERVEAMRRLRDCDLAVHAALAPILPCDPEALAALAIEATERDVLGDPLHSRAGKPSGATTRQTALELSERYGWSEWHEPRFQAKIVDRLRIRIEAAGRRFDVGPRGFSQLAR